MAALVTGDGYLNPNPSYDLTSDQCNNTFCHGNWRVRKAKSIFVFAFTETLMTGTSYIPVFTGDSSQAICGSCHGIPPTGYAPAKLSTCGSCHTGILNSSAVIINEAKHLNGKINVFGDEHSF